MCPIGLRSRYGLSAEELLEALDRRFRAKVTLEGAVAEVQLGKHISAAVDAGAIVRFEEHDQDGYPDYTIWTPDARRVFRVECKNVRDSDEAYRQGGLVVAYKVETQKTRTSQDDPTSRFYGVDQFEILGVCLGKKTRNWSDFVFAYTKNLNRHARHPGKLAVMHRVPLHPSEADGIWHGSLVALLAEDPT
ncbi:MAG: hypothetical protein UZ13_02320 [Chloroflexi bacterium OLB13]|nr:MAG: hypothetical protein UZ13_02320 [Chloroflexi bacterium OLB13]